MVSCIVLFWCVVDNLVTSAAGILLEGKDSNSLSDLRRFTRAAASN
jgi:hypothetical protein